MKVKDPEGRTWSIGPQERDGNGIPKRSVTQLDSYGAVIRGSFNASRQLAEMEDHELRKLPHPALWFLADDRSASDKLSAIILEEPSWIKDVAAYSYGAVNEPGSQGRSPLLVAIDENRWDMIPDLLMMGALPGEPVRVSLTQEEIPFRTALEQQRVRILWEFVLEETPEVGVSEAELRACLKQVSNLRESEIPRSEREWIQPLLDKIAERLRLRENHDLRGVNESGQKRPNRPKWRK